MVGSLGALAVLVFHQLLLTLESALHGSSQGLLADAKRRDCRVCCISTR